MLVVWRINRIGRSKIDVIAAFTGLVGRGIAICSLSDAIGPSTREDRRIVEATHYRHRLAAGAS